MKIYVIAVWGKGEPTPWIATAWDEWSMEENPSGFEAVLKTHKNRYSNSEVQVGIVEVPDDFLREMFAPHEAKGTVVPE